MKLGLGINYYSFAPEPARLGPMLAEIAQTADGAGFAIIGVVDHLWQHPIMGGPELEELEGYTTLGPPVGPEDVRRGAERATGGAS